MEKYTNDLVKITRLNDLVADAISLQTNIGQYLFENGVEPRESAKWIKSDYAGKSKDIFYCSRCNHYQSVSKTKAEQVMYMKYCPFCGARMEV